MKRQPSALKWARAQRGAAGIEFALLFTIFFGVFYAVLSYAFIVLLHQGLVQAAAEGARAAVRIDRTEFNDDGQYKAACQALAQAAAANALSWMPQSVQTKIVGGAGITFDWTDSTVAINTGNGTQKVSAKTITVKVTYANYAASPLLPLLSLPGLGTIPDVPTSLVGASTLRVTN
jgi:Flp pilus assembly protein TadG